MPTERSIRELRLTEIKEGTPYMTGIRIAFDGEKRAFDAFKIPLSCLIYNKHNGRIGAQVKSLERQGLVLDPQTEEGEKKIAKLLWESKQNRNQQTLDNLLQNGQQKFGIVTRDGVIIDGNRRAMLLNTIWNKREEYRAKNHNVDECQYFIAVILDELAEDKRVLRLETTFQMGEDEKLDYDPIEKYLKCKDLRAVGFEEKDIAQMMGEERETITEWLGIMKLMDQYLDHLGYSGIYTRLEKREGQFVDLHRYLQRYDGEEKSSMVTWPYEKEDVADLKSVAFDYIRAQYEGKEFRTLGKPSKSESAFCQRGVWDELLSAHKAGVESIVEKSVEELRRDSPGVDLSKLLAARDDEWTKIAMDTLKANLGKATSQLDDIQRSSEPVKLLDKASDALNSIKVDVPIFFDDSVAEKLKAIAARTYELQKLHKKGLQEA